MKVVILAGGTQSTLNYDEKIPKPMLEIGGKPLLWHIMKHFSKYKLTDFIVCGGYKVDVIKEYFKDFYIYESDITVDLKNNTLELHKMITEDWRVTVVDTGLTSSPGQRINLISRYLQLDSDEAFIVTYGDCLSNVDLNSLLEEHYRGGKLATLVIAKPQGRKQLLAVDETGLIDYEKLCPAVEEAAWINADCFVLDKKVLACLETEKNLEDKLFKDLAKLGQVASYKHEGYWSSIETMRDLVAAEKLWDIGKTPWI